MLDNARLRLTLLPLLLLGSLVACSSIPSTKSLLESASPYRFDRVQGNVVTREQFNALKAGMPRVVVRDILGTPLLVSVFHADRWDYVFSLLRQGAEPQARRVTVYFKGDLLDRFDADDLPSEAEFVATLKHMPITGKIPAMEATPESLEKFPPSTKPVVTAPAATKLPNEYPPLEPLAK